MTHYTWRAPGCAAQRSTMAASETTPTSRRRCMHCECKKSVRAAGGTGYIYTNNDLFVLHARITCKQFFYICIDRIPGECFQFFDYFHFFGCFQFFDYFHFFYCFQFFDYYHFCDYLTSLTIITSLTTITYLTILALVGHLFLCHPHYLHCLLPTKLSVAPHVLLGNLATTCINW